MFQIVTATRSDIRAVSVSLGPRQGYTRQEGNSGDDQEGCRIVRYCDSGPDHQRVSKPASSIAETGSNQCFTKAPLQCL